MINNKRGSISCNGLWVYNVLGVDRPIDILGVYRPGSTCISSNASGVDRPNKWEYIGQGVDRLVTKM